MTRIPPAFAAVAEQLGREEEVVVLRGGPSPWVLAKSPRVVYEVLIRKEGIYTQPPHPFAKISEAYAETGATLLGLRRSSPRDFFSAAVDRCFEAMPLLEESPSMELESRLKRWCARLLLDLLWQASSPSLDRFVQEIALQERSPPGSAPKGAPSQAAFLAQIFAASPTLQRLDSRDPSVRDAVIRTFLNGYNALAIGLVWSLVELGRDEGLRGRLRSEEALVEDFVAEILRLYPPAWSLTRRLVHPDELAGIKLPPGTLVQVSPFVTHRDPQYWSQPETLRLERSRKARRQEELRYFPFGAGARICPSARLAPLLLKSILLRCLNSWEVELLEPSAPEPVGWISLHPVPSPKLAVTPRIG